MPFARITSLALFAAASVSAGSFHRRFTSGSLRVRGPEAAAASSDNNSYMCSVGPAKCCNTVIEDQATKKTSANLAGLSSLEGMVALSCTEIPVLAGALHNQCKSTPVCCDHVDQSGLINIGCNAILIN